MSNWKPFTPRSFPTHQMPQPPGPTPSLPSVPPPGVNQPAPVIPARKDR